MQLVHKNALTLSELFIAEAIQYMPSLSTASDMKKECACKKNKFLCTNLTKIRINQLHLSYDAHPNPILDGTSDNFHNQGH